jgi:hypothetical protein
MKNIFYILIILGLVCIINSPVFADENAEALKFFKRYVNAANSYDPALAQMYSPDARIIRQVVKPDGELVNVETDTDTYIKQMRLGQTTAKLRRYKNTYTNITSQKVDNGYKISALRQPSGETYRLKTYMVVKKDSSGKWHIAEELMQTKVQTFLKYAKR